MRSKRPAIVFVLIAFLAVAGCKKKGDEELIRGVVDRAVSAAEAKDVSGLMKFVSKDYSDGRGNDYGAIRGVLFYELMRPERIRVFVQGLSAEVKGDRAVLGARVFVVRGREIKSIGDIVPQDADSFRLSVILRKEGGAWKALGADWDSGGVP